ncbi:hypothetical protein ACLOJK_029975 [Asimina triloba]
MADSRHSWRRKGEDRDFKDGIRFQTGGLVKEKGSKQGKRAARQPPSEAASQRTISSQPLPGPTTKKARWPMEIGIDAAVDLDAQARRAFPIFRWGIGAWTTKAAVVDRNVLPALVPDKSQSNPPSPISFVESGTPRSRE